MIDNRDLMPPLLPDDQVALERAAIDGEALTPDWAKTLIMQELHIETATPEGSLASAVPVLDHLAEMGVNGIWVTPIYEKGPGGNGYGNTGPHRVESALTGTTDQDACWDAVRRFVEEAHKRSIRVLLDIITWGTMMGAPLKAEHPDWFNGTAWGNAAFDWSVEEFREWFIDVATRNLLRTGADGYRCDCEPNHTGYTVFNRVRENCLKAGRKVLIMAEDGCLRDNGCFDLEQDGVLNYIGWDRGAQYKHPRRFYLDDLNIVESVKTGRAIGCSSLQQKGEGGRYRFYTYCVSNHDFEYSITNGNRLVIGYQAIFAPFIPLWYYGAEFNMQAESKVIYFVPVTKEEKLADPANAAFFEDVKRYIRIRRSFPEIFEYYPIDHRDANICAVNASGSSLQAYARYAGGKAILIVGNKDADPLRTTVEIPFEEAAIARGALKITDLMTGRTLAEGMLERFEAEIPAEHIGVYCVQSAK